jgi:hypothetical protein
MMYLDLPQTTFGPLRDTAVFDMGTDGRDRGLEPPFDSFLNGQRSMR